LSQYFFFPPGNKGPVLATLFIRSKLRHKVH
jgi:hypothetical protein